MARSKNPPQRIHSQALTDAYLDFMLSRQALNCTEATMAFYKFQIFPFLLWVDGQSINTPNDITVTHVRQFLAERRKKGQSDCTLNAAARAIRTLVRFWHSEGLISELITFAMPKIGKKHLPELDKKQLKLVIRACNLRDRALVLIIADSGLRKQEVINLNWGDLSMLTGLVKVHAGKGRKDRESVIGPTTRKWLKIYKKSLKHKKRRQNAIFPGRGRERLTGSGVNLIFRRLSKRTGIHVTAHALRRTFTILSLRAGMDILHLQSIGGWESVELVEHYAQIVSRDVLREHRKHSPIESLK